MSTLASPSHRHLLRTVGIPLGFTTRQRWLEVELTRVISKAQSL